MLMIVAALSVEGPRQACRQVQTGRKQLGIIKYGHRTYKLWGKHVAMKYTGT